MPYAVHGETAHASVLRATDGAISLQGPRPLYSPLFILLQFYWRTDGLREFPANTMRR